MNKEILVDVDGVLFKWLDPFKQYMVSCGYELTDNQQHSYSMFELFKNISKDQIFEMVEQFNNSDGFSDLPPIDHSIEGIKELTRHGYRFSVITSSSGTERSAELRKKNLLNVYGDVFNEIICIPLNCSKIEHLKKFDPTYWIEDKPENAIDGYDIGHHAMLLKRDVNRKFEDPRIPKFDNWNEIVEYILMRKK